MSEEEKKAIFALNEIDVNILNDEENEAINIITRLVKKQDKQIDLMADFINMYTLSGEENQYCHKVINCEVVGGNKSCIDCIKEHFRKEVKND